MQQPQVTGQHNAIQQPFQSSAEGINIPEFENFLAKIMQSCTKENISVRTINFSDFTGLHGNLLLKTKWCYIFTFIRMIEWQKLDIQTLQNRRAFQAGC